MGKKVIFMGTPSYATEILKHLLQGGCDIKAVVTAQDKKQGRGQKLSASHIKQYCIDNNCTFDILQPKNVKEHSFVEVLKKYKADFIVVGAYGQILSQEILDITTCINLHASLLPNYRGASPIHSSILNNDKFSGVSAMKMSLKMDVGDVLGMSYYKIKNAKNIIQAYNELSVMAGCLAVRVIDNYDKLQPKKQNNVFASYCKKIKKEDGLIDFSNARDIYLKYKAFYLWPQVFSKDNIKIKNLDLHNASNKHKKALEILQINKSEKYIIISCLIGELKIFSIAEPSKKEITAMDFLSKKGLKIGDYLF